MLDVDALGIIDGDGHVIEDVPAIMEYLPKEFRESSLIGLSGTLFPSPPPFTVSLARLPEGAGGDPGLEGWTQLMDDLSFGAAVLYPTYGLSHSWLVDADLAIAAARAYNDWLAATYLTSPRLKGMALLPMQEPDAAVDELRRSVTELGMLGAVLLPTGLSQHLGAKAYWPVYAEAERLQCCISVHGGIHAGLGIDKVNVVAVQHALGHACAQAISLGSMLFNGVFDRFPTLRIAYLEGGVGWLLMAMERYSGSYASVTPLDPRKELIQLDSGESVADYIAKRIEEGRLFIGIEGDEHLLPTAVEMVGDRGFIFSSDFPHEVNRETIGRELGELLDNDKLRESTKAAILRDNALRFYRCGESAAHDGSYADVPTPGGAK